MLLMSQETLLPKMPTALVTTRDTHSLALQGPLQSSPRFNSTDEAPWRLHHCALPDPSTITAPPAVRAAAPHLSCIITSTNRCRPFPTEAHPYSLQHIIAPSNEQTSVQSYLKKKKSYKKSKTHNITIGTQYFSRR